MTVFVLLAAVMIAAALTWVLVPLLRSHRPPSVVREAANVEILRDQLAELDADRATGALPADKYEQARRELDQRVLDDSVAPANTAEAAIAPRAGAWTAAILGGAIPIVAVVLYLSLGGLQVFVPGGATTAAATGGEHDLSPEQVQAMIDKLEAKLASEPGNVEGWVILARTYYSMKRYPEAVRAFDRAVAILPNDPDLLADYADALGAVQGNTLAGKPMELIGRALAADPTHWKALALAGTDAFNRKDYRKAVEYWEKLKATAPPDSPIAGSIDGSIAEARALAGMKPATPAAGVAATGTATTTVAGAPVANASAAAKAAPAAGAAAATKPAGVAGVANAAGAPAAGGGSVAGTVTLAPALAAKAAPTDVVFIFARAAQGPRMPLAILRKQVKDLPVTFSLDDSMAMTPEMKLSSFPSIVVGARVSRSGNAMPQSGDLEGLSPPMAGGAAGVSITIDRQLP